MKTFMGCVQSKKYTVGRGQDFDFMICQFWLIVPSGFSVNAAHVQTYTIHSHVMYSTKGSGLCNQITRHVAGNL